MGIDRKLNTYPLQTPILGMNSRDDRSKLPPGYCKTLENWICRNDILEARRGHSQHIGSLGGSVRSLISSYSETGAAKLLAATNGAIFDITDGVAVQKGAGFLSDDWQHTTLDGFTVMANGRDTPLYYKASVGNLLTTAFTPVVNSGFSSSTIVQFHNYRGRLYGVKRESGDVFFGPDGAVASGAFDRLRTSFQFSRGGYVMWVSSYSRDTGSATSELLVVASSQGEILVYTGAFPGSDDFELISKFYVGKPIGRRSFFWIGPDLIIITVNGVYPLSSLLSIGQVNEYAAISNTLMRDFNDSARNYGSLFGWQGLVWEEGGYGLINVPITTSRAIQYVFNPNSRAWSRFTGLNATCWQMLDGKLYFGTSDGRVMLMEGSSSDLGVPIKTKIELGWSSFNNEFLEKELVEARLYFNLERQADFVITRKIDYSAKEKSFQSNTLSAEGEQWNTFKWNATKWAGGLEPVTYTVGLDGVGTYFQLGLNAELKNTRCELSAIRVLFNQGSSR